MFSFQCRGLGCFQFSLIMNVLDLDALCLKFSFFAASDKDVINFCILNLYPAILLILVFFKEALGFL